MARLQQLQPEMKAIQAKYKDDKQRQQQEMMKFYKDNKVNPLGSCLPLVAQLPVFISLFYMLRKNLRTDICPAIQRAHDHGVLTTAHTVPCGPHGGAGFLFVSDLTNKASGVTLIVLIVLYIGTQLASSLMMSAATMDATQRKIMLVMPLFFVLFVINFPAGVIVYWITTNTWTMAQQFVIRRRIAARAPIVAVGGVGTGSGATSVVPTSRSGPKRRAESVEAAKSSGNGASSGGGIGALLRGRAKTEQPAAVGTAARQGPPPRPPRKKKKRSGRRR
jgi:YidC/Oxa1 family membrane protein insertase